MRLLVAEFKGPGELIRLAEDRQVTRLGESVFSSGVLSEEAMRATEAVLARFRGIIADFSVGALRAVATSATRDAANGTEFLALCGRALGVPIEVISGVEEARLIALGVEAAWPQSEEPVLIIDVGGGSAEFILSKAGSMVEGYSKPLGAVRLKEMFLAKDPPKREHLLRMQEYIDQKLELPVRRLGGQPFVRCIATSASAAAIVCAANSIHRVERAAADRRSATLEQVRKLYRDLALMPLERRRKTVGIGPRRAEIIVAGVAVFLRAMERFDLPALQYSIGGVREGVIVDLATRETLPAHPGLSHVQRKIVESFAKRFGISLAHAKATAAFASQLFDGLESLHRLEASYRALLEAACFLLDVGHYVSGTGHHKHSYYLVANSDMPGFTEREKAVIAALCRYHRKSLPAARHSEYQKLNAADRRAVELLTPLIRIADALDQSRDQHVQLEQCEIRGEQVQLKLAVASDKDAELEQWALERTFLPFRQVYGKQLAVSGGASGRAALAV